MRRRADIVAAGLLAVALALSAFLMFEWASGAGQSRVPEVSLDLGITYLPVTPRLGLGIDKGDMVTAVAPDSLADRAGIRAGDVLLQFNSVPLGQDTPLLGVMRTCRVGHTIVLDVWRQNTVSTVQFVHTER